MNDIFSRCFWADSGSSFFLFLPSFFRSGDAIHDETRVFLFRRFFVRIFKTREEYMFSFKFASRRDFE